MLHRLEFQLTPTNKWWLSKFGKCFYLLNTGKLLHNIRQMHEVIRHRSLSEYNVPLFHPNVIWKYVECVCGVTKRSRWTKSLSHGEWSMVMMIGLKGCFLFKAQVHCMWFGTFSSYIAVIIVNLHREQGKWFHSRKVVWCIAWCLFIVLCNVSVGTLTMAVLSLTFINHLLSLHLSDVHLYSIFNKV